MGWRGWGKDREMLSLLNTIYNLTHKQYSTTLKILNTLSLHTHHILDWNKRPWLEGSGNWEATWPDWNWTVIIHTKLITYQQSVYLSVLYHEKFNSQIGNQKSQIKFTQNIKEILSSPLLQILWSVIVILTGYVWLSLKNVIISYFLQTK